jgi:phosphinothricin acetyltransferase
MIVIRRATLAELKPITEIYNDAILHTVATFDTKPKTIEEQKAWFAEHDAKHPLLVAKEDGLVVGWASLSRWSDRCAYSDTAEVSLYVKSECRERGIGRKLLGALVEKGEKAGLHTILARITEGNEASLALFKSESFETVGVMKEVGRKFGMLLDVHLLQKIYS